MSDPTIPQNDKFHQDTNELDDFATKLKIGWTQWGNLLTIGLGLAVLTFVVAGPMGWFGRKNLLETYRDKHHEEVYRGLTSDSPDVLASQSLTCPDPKIGAVMALRGADLFLKNSQTADKDEDAQKALARAEKLYQQVVANPAADAMLKTDARLGLGSVAESKQDWAGAEAAYDQVIKDKGTLPNLVALAQSRKNILPTLKQPVVFGPEPVKATPVPAQAPKSGPSAPPAALAAPSAPAAASASVPLTTPVTQPK